MIAQPLLADGGGVLGVLVVVTTRTPGPGMLGAVGEVARYAASQIELAELDASRARLDRAEVLALRAQISPHFIYNALNTIASFVRTDPDRARELILEFADFTRYSFRAAGQYTTLADELRNIDRYLTLERARFGDALKVKLQVAPEVLNVVVPFLALQPLVENAVRHGFAGRSGGTIEIVARDEGTDCVITVEDDGVGMDPETLRSGPADALADVGLRRPVRARRADQCRPSAARRVRQRLRSGGRDRDRRGHQGHDAGTEVPVGRRGPAEVPWRRPKPIDRARGRRRGARARRARPTCCGSIPTSARSAAPATPRRRCASCNERAIDAVFLDINMPGLYGLELAGVLAQLRRAARGGVRDRPRRQGRRRVRRRCRRLPAQADPAGPPRRGRASGRCHAARAEQAGLRRRCRARTPT